MQKSMLFESFTRWQQLEIGWARRQFPGRDKPGLACTSTDVASSPHHLDQQRRQIWREAPKCNHSRGKAVLLAVEGWHVGCYVHRDIAQLQRTTGQETLGGVGRCPPVGIDCTLRDQARTRTHHSAVLPFPSRSRRSEARARFRSGAVAGDAWSVQRKGSAPPSRHRCTQPWRVHCGGFCVRMRERWRTFLLDGIRSRGGCRGASRTWRAIERVWRQTATGRRQVQTREASPSAGALLPGGAAHP